VNERLARVHAILDDVRDPEIPAISITDLGIVRDVRAEGETVVVALTPTYSGCPATRVIEEDVVRALHERGEGSVRVETRLSPPWSTDWISVRGRERLREFGIAPPAATLADGPAVVAVRCPRCGSFDTHEQSRFGSTPCKALYRCSACAEPFDYFKAH